MAATATYQEQGGTTCVIPVELVVLYLSLRTRQHRREEEGSTGCMNYALESNCLLEFISQIRAVYEQHHLRVYRRIRVSDVSWLQ
ncbi:hypothetical protein NDU88_001176 [Pleurodeles waltl]|uniref:Uncharacterized protein n=1 Tax=Pleurodeles waltl TaxID=8319 RepID=A0AAV7L912_PLEWA|nr:hypothetical protein NDU88_001176 [Pleurodeles waltl]